MDANSYVYFSYCIEDSRHDYTATVGILVVWVIRLCNKTLYAYIYYFFQTEKTIVVVMPESHDEV